MIAPLVAGSCALVLQSHPTWSPMDVRTALLSTASRASQPDNDYGYGIPDILAAINYDQDPVPRGQKLQIETAYPNPYVPSGPHNQFVLRWTAAVATVPRINVYNLLGQHITTLSTSTGAALGKGVVVWQGRDAHGRMVPAGVYFIQLSADRQATVRRVIVTH